MNTFAYASSNPVANIDSYGLRDTTGMLREVTRIGAGTAALDGPEVGPMDLVALLVMGGAAAHAICKDSCDDAYANIYRLMEYLRGK